MLEDHMSVQCDGGEDSLGHPLVYLAFDETGEVKCPYCGTLYVVKSSLT